MSEKNVKLDEKYAKWRGIPREEINWNPEINESKCVGCGMCIVSCGRDVFGFDKEKKKAVVVNPLQCQVGCTSCEVWCIYDAISFPDPQYVKDLIKKKKLVAMAKKQLAEKLEQRKEV
jgi:NAD-dependent dihydropyrimidine dehydrogenase PreA subunit